MSDFQKTIEAKYPNTTDCLVLSRQIEALIIEEDFYRKQFDTKASEIIHNYLIAKRKWFEVFNCEVKLAGKKAELIGDIITYYSSVDEKRINESVQKNINQRIILGVLILLAGIGIVIQKK